MRREHSVRRRSGALGVVLALALVAGAAALVAAPVPAGAGVATGSAAVWCDTGSLAGRSTSVGYRVATPQAEVAPGDQVELELSAHVPTALANEATWVGWLEVTWPLTADVGAVDDVSFSSVQGWSSEVVEVVPGSGGHVTVRHTGGPATKPNGTLRQPPSTTLTFTVAPSDILHALAWPTFSSVAVGTLSPTGEAEATCTPTEPDQVLYDDTLVVPPVPTFWDLPRANPFYVEVSTLAWLGIIDGYPDGSFRPTTPVSRQAMAAYVYRLAGEPPVDLPPEPTFWDVPASSTFYEAIEWLAGTGITSGYPDGSFRPAEPITRQHMAAFLYRMAGSPIFPLPPDPLFWDVPTHSRFRIAIEFLALTGITTGYDDGSFRPLDLTSRQVMAAFLFRFVEAVAQAQGTVAGTDLPARALAVASEEVAP